MNANETKSMQALRLFEAGPIPPGYCKVIHVGPEGETSIAEVTPTDVAAQRWCHSDTYFSGRLARAIVVVHLHGVTIIEFDDNSASSKTILPE